jgi:glycosyltransferase involved in cell wall biosynthesis
MPGTMFSNRIYYRFKPYLPWRLRMGMRRLVARRKRDAFKNVWPINEAASRLPENWRGWPDGKKFALVLTHDVEGSGGLAKCHRLMELEHRMGFRSSFNFIPEGDYSVSPELRNILSENGFEVGVHDLRHDGKLYWRRNNFFQSARSINRYLETWKASGFRAAFMLHDRERLHHLNIEYDASTFDTDPFEPQPDGVNTIFPFWISDGNGGGYVELPYTLPQDSTLFLVLDEKSPDIWKTKLDWLVKHGGMALLNVHPDYIGFRKDLEACEYPAQWYEEFLSHIRERYAGEFWNPLPREMAHWFKENYRPKSAVPSYHANGANGHHTELASPAANAAVVLYSYYASDPRPRREAEALSNAGAEVDVICLRKDWSEPAFENINGVNVHRIPLKRRRAGKLTYIFQYACFLAASFTLLTLWSFKKRFRLVHIHNMPDFLVFSALVPRLRGAKIILDLHDPMPELFRSIYHLNENHFIVRWLEKMERDSASFADLVLTPNIAFKELFKSRSCAPNKIQTVMNSPEATIFNSENGAGANGNAHSEPAGSESNGRSTFRLMYHGLIVERHGLDLAVEALAKLKDRIPGIELHLYGERTDYLEKIFGLARQLNLGKAIQFHGFKPLREIAKDISKADLGIVPNRLTVFTQINFPTRIFEYLAMNKPVLVPRTRGISDYFNESEILFFEPDNVDDLAARIAWAYEHPSELQRLTENGRRIYENNCWELEQDKFLGMVENLIKDPVPSTATEDLLLNSH